MVLMARCNSGINVSWVTYFDCAAWFTYWFCVIYYIGGFFLFCFFL